MPRTAGQVGLLEVFKFLKGFDCLQMTKHTDHCHTGMHVHNKFLFVFFNFGHFHYYLSVAASTFQPKKTLLPCPAGLIGVPTSTPEEAEGQNATSQRGWPGRTSLYTKNQIFWNTNKAKRALWENKNGKQNKAFKTKETGGVSTFP